MWVALLIFFQFYSNIIDTSMYKFKLYSIKIWYTYTLQNDYRNKFNIHHLT